MLYAKAPAKLEAALKRRKNKKQDFALLAKFKGQFPPSLARVMSGEAVNGGVGFHSIALQIAITANALGKTEEEILELCEGLVNNLESDSTRYNTPAKRRMELARLHTYTQDNLC